MTHPILSGTLLGLFCANVLAVRADRPDEPVSTFSLKIEEDRGAAIAHPGLHRILVHLTRDLPGVELEQFHRESEGMYNIIVLHDGKQAKETCAMRALRDYRKIDDNPHIERPGLLKKGQTWTTQLDVSDYYDMSGPGIYQITVTRESLPLNRRFSTLVQSNSISISVRIHAVSRREFAKPKPAFGLFISREERDSLLPLIISVERTNTSREVIRERKCWSFMGMYDISVVRDGIPLEGNRMMQELKRSRAQVDCPGNETLQEIGPGESEVEEIPVSNYFDFSMPGSYVVYVSRESVPWNPAKSVVVESNAISVVISTLHQTSENDAESESPPL